MPGNSIVGKWRATQRKQAGIIARLCRRPLDIEPLESNVHLHEPDVTGTGVKVRSRLYPDRNSFTADVPLTGFVVDGKVIPSRRIQIQRVLWTRNVINRDVITIVVALNRRQNPVEKGSIL